MESWRRVWREGIAPLLSTKSLEALRRGLESNSPCILQGVTSQPPSLTYYANEKVEACCALSYCGWQGEGLETVAEVEEFFARMCYEIDQRMGEPAAVRYFLGWFDEQPRDIVFKALIEECQKALDIRSLSDRELETIRHLEGTTPFKVRIEE